VIIDNEEQVSIRATEVILPTKIANCFSVEEHNAQSSSGFTLKEGGTTEKLGLGLG